MLRATLVLAGVAAGVGAASAARAEPAPPPPAPWLDLQPAAEPSPVAALAQPGPPDATAGHPIAASATLGGLYLGFAGWMYAAWYAKHKPLADYKLGGDGWLGDTTYAGGADKLGHAWATMALARLGTETLSQWGGFDRDRSLVVGTLLSELLFAAVEVKDGFYYELSYSDLFGDTTGALLALALGYWPRLDEMFDFRVQYFPSTDYAHEFAGGRTAPLGGKLNIAEDYSGETFLLAYHLGSLAALRDRPGGTFARFVDVAVGFDSRGYKPEPIVDGVPTQLPASAHHQNLFIGVSLNAQGLLDWLLADRPAHARGRKLGHALFEVFNLPATSAPLPGLQWTRTPSAEPAQDGA